mgnify:CR=1 FL=1
MAEYLPVGSVVLLEGGKKKTIIMGILQMDAETPERVYDYLGVPYPEGYLGQGSSYLFDHSDIAQLVYCGYNDAERQGFMQSIDALCQSVKTAINEKDGKGSIPLPKDMDLSKLNLEDVPEEDQNPQVE